MKADIFCEKYSIFAIFLVLQVVTVSTRCESLQRNLNTCAKH